MSDVNDVLYFNADDGGATGRELGSRSCHRGPRAGYRPLPRSLLPRIRELTELKRRLVLRRRRLVWLAGP